MTAVVEPNNVFTCKISKISQLSEINKMALSIPINTNNENFFLCFLTLFFMKFILLSIVLLLGNCLL